MSTVSVVKTKKKNKNKNKGKSAVTELTELQKQVDVLGKLDKKIKKLEEKYKPLVKEFKAIKEDLLSKVDDVSIKTEKSTQIGDEYIAEFGVKGKSTVITDKESVFNTIGVEAFSELVSVPITALRAITTKEQFESFSEVVQEGARSVKLTKKAS